MKTEEKYTIVKKGFGERIKENGIVEYNVFVIIDKKWFWNKFSWKTKCYLHEGNYLYSYWEYRSEIKFFNTKEEAFDNLNIAISKFFEKIKVNNIISYKENYI